MRANRTNQRRHPALTNKRSLHNNSRQKNTDQIMHTAHARSLTRLRCRTPLGLQLCSRGSGTQARHQVCCQSVRRGKHIHTYATHTHGRPSSVAQASVRAHNNIIVSSSSSPSSSPSSSASLLLLSRSNSSTAGTFSRSLAPIVLAALAPACDAGG